MLKPSKPVSVIVTEVMLGVFSAVLLASAFRDSSNLNILLSRVCIGLIPLSALIALIATPSIGRRIAIFFIGGMALLLAGGSIILVLGKNPKTALFPGVIALLFSWWFVAYVFGSAAKDYYRLRKAS